MRKLTINSTAVFALVAITALSLVQFASARTEPQAHASGTAISVSGKEFSFKLSKKSLARPGTATFTFKNAGHMLHDFKINGKKTSLIKPGQDGEAHRLVQAQRQVQLPVHRARARRGRNERRIHRSLSSPPPPPAAASVAGGPSPAPVLEKE